jgi:rhodanese-related sulfurtransferase
MREDVMMKKITVILRVLLLTGATYTFAGSVDTMDKDELKAMLGSFDLVLLDVRAGRDWSSSEFKIKGAQRLEKNGYATAMQSYGKEKTLVFYCA